MSLSDVIKISYVVSTCRTWWSFLTLSAKFPHFYTFFSPNLDKKVSLSDVIKISYVVSTCRTWWSITRMLMYNHLSWGWVRITKYSYFAILQSNNNSIYYLVFGLWINTFLWFGFDNYPRTLFVQSMVLTIFLVIL